MRHAFRQIVGPNFDAAAAHVVAQFDERLGRLDRGGEFAWIRGVKFLGTSQTNQRHGAVGKASFHFASLAGIETRFDAMLVGRAQLDAECAGFLAIGQQRRQVPIGAPLVSHEPEPHFGRIAALRLAQAGIFTQRRRQKSAPQRLRKFGGTDGDQIRS